MEDTIDLAWIKNILKIEFENAQKDWKVFSDARESVCSSVEQLNVLKNSLHPFIEESIEEANAAASDGEAQKCIDILQKALEEIKDFLNLQPILVSKEIEKVELGMKAAIDKSKTLQNIEYQSIERVKYLVDLEKKVSSEIDEDTTGSRKKPKQRKPGTKPDKLKDVRKAIERVKKRKSQKKVSKKEENKEE